ncbi:MAG: FAD-binding oxidoreductase [Marinibacterium sp.]|nr:FAD-binding oxidoreductase [Marinibacterium sp.]
MIDFLVIGGGIAGLSAGARLSELGSVVLLDMEDALGYHTSGRSAATFEPNYGAPPVQALNRASADYHQHAHGGYLSPRGLMSLARPEESAAFDTELAAMGLTEISTDEALARVPILRRDRLGRAGYGEDAQDIDTDRLMADFARVIRKGGGQIQTGTAVTAIRRIPAGWSVTTPHGAHEARQIINAAGAWADQIAVLAGLPPIGITPLRRSMARIAAPGGADVTGWPMIFGMNEGWYAKPDAGALLVSPAEEDPTTPHDAYADDMVLAEGLAAYEDMVTIPVTRPIANWAGLRSFAPDRALVLGPDPTDPGFVWCAGQGGYGMQTAPGASRLLADLLGGHPPELPPEIVAALRPDRLRRGAPA